MQAEEYSLP